METVFHHPDRKEKLFFLISGMIMSVPFTILTEALSGYFLDITALPFFLVQVLIVAVVAPILEEFAKAYPLFYRHGETQKSLISLGFYTGLGFGLVEFILYVFFLQAPVLIRIVAFLFHAANTSIVAYGIARRKTMRFYVLAVILHATVNFSALAGPTWIIAGIGAVILAYFLAILLSLISKEKMISY